MLYREFVLRSPANWQALAQLVAQNAKVFADCGKPLRVIVTEDEKKRTDAANRFYWGAVLSAVAEQAWVAGKQYSKDVWHEHFARQYLPHTEIVTPFGEVIARRKSTTELTVSEFSEYLQRVQSESASSLGVQFD